MMADMKRKPAFGSALAPIVPTPEDEAALTEAARAEGFADRGAGVSAAETAPGIIDFTASWPNGN